MKRERVDIHTEEDTRQSRGKYRRHKRDLSMRKARSLLTNDPAAILADCDQRGSWVKRFKDVCRTHLLDLATDPDTLSESQRALARRVTVLQLLSEMMEARFVTQLEDDILPGLPNIELYARLSESQKRLAEALGVERGRRSKEVRAPSHHDPNTADLIDAIRNGEFTDA